QLDTWDLKPDAPDNIRGPFRPIPTNVPGIEIGEHFPLMARRADRYAVLRSIYHREAPIHETACQLLQTGRWTPERPEWPPCGAVAGKLRPTSALPSWVLLPGNLGNTGVSISHGQTSGFLGALHAPYKVGLEVAVAGKPGNIDPAHLDGSNRLMDV